MALDSPKLELIAVEFRAQPTKGSPDFLGLVVESDPETHPGVVLDTLDAIGGSDLRNRYATAKKGDLANAAEKLCAGASIVEAEVRAAALAWVPDVMQFARAADVSAAADDGGPPESDTGGADSPDTDDPDAKDEPGADDDEVEQAVRRVLARLRECVGGTLRD